ncbi:MarR family transcriptional regulator [Oculatella sp. LEGE 06141]|uniref:MarR family winged helix-turn-helix transcriptional regulator n=1 Tax=Oculatella sp. LEGE 06141 TaxID=1828648 RepID=UPI001880B337|nr:MarR family transcriptional regulator [Oculatella sp. LEGE 06141]MBE9181195.1 MarR family transcriptional regulator [Oculatella sp. LEGE 06141]
MLPHSVDQDIKNVDQATGDQPVNPSFVEQWREVIAPYGLGYRIKILSQLQARRFQEKLDPFGLTPFHWVVLCCLWEEDGLSTSSIGDKLQQVGGTLTGVLDRMEERSLIRRERDRHDRRVWRIWLTEEGEKLRSVLLPIAIQVRDATLEGLSPTDRQMFSRFIDQAIANLQP